MKITQVNVRLLPLSDDHALAVASIVLDDAYAINGIRVIRRADGELQILYPCLPTRIHIHKRQVFAFKPINRPAHIGKCSDFSPLQRQFFPWILGVNLPIWINDPNTLKMPAKRAFSECRIKQKHQNGAFATTKPRSTRLFRQKVWCSIFLLGADSCTKLSQKL